MLQHAYFVVLNNQIKGKGGLRFRKIKMIVKPRPQLGGSFIVVNKTTTRRIVRSCNQDPTMRIISSYN